MRLVETKNKIHHGTFNDEGVLVDKNGNPLPLITSELSEDELETIKDVLDKYRNAAGDGDNNPFSNNQSSDGENSSSNSSSSSQSSSSNSSNQDGSQSGPQENSSDSQENDSSNENESQENSSDSQGDIGDNSQGDSDDNSSDDAGEGSSGDQGDGDQSQNQSPGNEGEEPQKFKPDPKKTYIDIRNNKHYKWDGTKFVEVPA